MRQAVLVLALVLLAVATAFGQEEPPAAKPDWQTALDAFRAKDQTALSSLAAATKEDPWLVADALCAAGEFDAAAAFVSCVKQGGCEKLAAYVTSRRAARGDDAVRKADIRGRPPLFNFPRQSGASGIGGGTDEAVAYDALNRLAEAKANDSPRGAGSRTVQFTYDSLSLVLTKVQGDNSLAASGNSTSYASHAGGDRTEGSSRRRAKTQVLAAGEGRLGDGRSLCRAAAASKFRFCPVPVGNHDSPRGGRSRAVPFTYDSLSRVLTVVQGENRLAASEKSTSYTHDAEGDWSSDLSWHRAKSPVVAPGKGRLGRGRSLWRAAAASKFRFGSVPLETPIVRQGSAMDAQR